MGFFSKASMIMQKDLQSQVKLEIYKGIRRLEDSTGKSKLSRFNKETKRGLWSFCYGISVVGFDLELDKNLEVINRNKDSIYIVAEAMNEAGYPYFGVGNNEHYFYYIKGIEYFLEMIKDPSDEGQWRKVLLEVSQQILDY